MRIYKGNPELVFRGRVAPWYGALSGIVCVAAAVLALQPGMPAVVPAAVLVVAAVALWPVVVRNRVELYGDRLRAIDNVVQSGRYEVTVSLSKPMGSLPLLLDGAMTGYQWDTEAFPACV